MSAAINWVAGITIACGFYMMIRNWCAFHYMQDLLKQISKVVSARSQEAFHRGDWDEMHRWLDLYSLRPDYDHVMGRFWVWPLSRFGTIETIEAEFRRRHSPPSSQTSATAPPSGRAAERSVKSEPIR